MRDSSQDVYARLGHQEDGLVDGPYQSPLFGWRRCCNHQCVHRLSNDLDGMRSYLAQVDWMYNPKYFSNFRTMCEVMFFYIPSTQSEMEADQGLVLLFSFSVPAIRSSRDLIGGAMCLGLWLHSQEQFLYISLDPIITTESAPSRQLSCHLFQYCSNTYWNEDNPIIVDTPPKKLKTQNDVSLSTQTIKVVVMSTPAMKVEPNEVMVQLETQTKSK